MENKYLIFALIPTLFIAACQPNNIVGNDTDEYGCLASAGYQWCNYTQRCQRTWEDPCINPQEQDAINTAISHLKDMSEYRDNNGKDVRVIGTKEKSCDGYWEVNLEFDSDEGKQYANITINNWRVVKAECYLYS